MTDVWVHPTDDPDSPSGGDGAVVGDGADDSAFVPRRLLPITVLLMSAIIAAGAWGGGERRLDAEVSAMLRIPINCDTPLVISKPGQFRVYVETSGVLPVGGPTCPRGGSAFRNTSTQVDVRMAVTAPSGVENPAVYVSENESYQRDGYRGYMLGEIDFTRAGTYTITTQAESADVAIALGPDLDDVRNGWRTSAAIIAVTGLLMAMILRRLPRRASGR